MVLGPPMLEKKNVAIYLQQYFNVSVSSIALRGSEKKKKKNIHGVGGPGGKRVGCVQRGFK